MTIENQARLDRILGIYKFGYRYLKEAKLVLPHIMLGKFKIPASVYVEDTRHLNAVELFVCYNQLAYVFLDERSRLQQDGLSCECMDVSELGKMQLEKCLICGADRMRFNGPINRENFTGTIEIKSSRKSKGDTYYRTVYDFGDGAATGEILLAKLQ